MRIARYYCPTAHETFSLLPDCLASHFPGALDPIEQVVATVETARSVEAAADVLRPDITLLRSAIIHCGRRYLASAASIGPRGSAAIIPGQMIRTAPFSLVICCTSWR